MSKGPGHLLIGHIDPILNEERKCKGIKISMDINTIHFQAITHCCLDGHCTNLLIAPQSGKPIGVYYPEDHGMWIIPFYEALIPTV